MARIRTRRPHVLLVLSFAVAVCGEALFERDLPTDFVNKQSAIHGHLGAEALIGR